ncbi:DUF7673 family protein [Pseudomonas asplenii]|uniref:DUF7673 domain-containing protein n=1 Tax=Pseudomonas asplenii TaxID=53407 RepID=A0A1H6MQ34_9PSED|nr:hypothetical protein [Pseudomonas fuscovaginae]SEH99819.1 hypothetical protein SAMN05216581_1114 [Pseudomonas fuscovaginae]
MSNGARTMATALAKVQAHQQQLPAIRVAGTQALNRLVPIALRDHGQSRVLGRFLLGIYNGEDFPFELSNLRSLDIDLFEDCLKVLIMDFTPDLEVHERIQGGSAIWQRLIERWAPETLE